MDENPVTTLSFAITSEAARQIRLLLAQFKKIYEKDAVPAFIWVDSTLNEGRIKSGIGIGNYTDRSEIEKDIVMIDGMEIVLAVPDEEMPRFLGKTVDFINGCFVVTVSPETQPSN